MNKTDPRYLKIGQACVELTNYSKFKIVLITLLFPRFAKKFLTLVEAITPVLEEGYFGTDEELGL